MIERGIEVTEAEIKGKGLGKVLILAGVSCIINGSTSVAN